MRDVKSLAAEIEAVTERERTRLIAWLAEYQVSTGTTIDREMTADALMADFIAPRLAEIAANQSRAFEDGARWMRERAYNAVIDVRHAAACNFAPEFSGAQGEARTNSLADAAKAVLALPLQPEGERSDA